MRKTLYIFSLIGLILINLLTVLSFLGYQNWLFDLFAHFELQYLMLTVFAFTILWVIKKQKLVLIFLPLFFYLSIDIGKLYVGEQKNLNIENSVKFSAINVLSSNTDYQKVIDFIHNENPEIVIIQEITPTWEAALNVALSQYSQRLIKTRNDNFGIALYSKIKLENLKIATLNGINLPSIQADFEIKNQKITLLATHPVPPINQDYFNKRNHQLSEIATFSKSIANEIIVIGDLNTTSFSRHFKNLQKQSKLIDSRKGFGIQPTWSVKGVWLTLDHCLISNGLGVKNRKVGQHIGSDHLPILVEIGVNR